MNKIRKISIRTILEKNQKLYADSDKEISFGYIDAQFFDILEKELKSYMELKIIEGIAKDHEERRLASINEIIAYSKEKTILQITNPEKIKKVLEVIK